jgi:hypothetical protein
MSLRSKLERQSEEEQKYLEEEIIKISEKGKRIAINGLFITGGLALSYLLFKYFVDDSKPSKKNKSLKIENNKSEEETKSLFGGITKSLAKQALIILLTMSKDKLIEYLNKGIESNEEHPSRTAK